MSDESIGEREQAQQKRRDRTLTVVAAIGLGAAMIWKFILPWTTLRTDLAFMFLTFIGLLAVSRLTRR